ncbi:MAG: LacI family DNA-binding transcriptional regulator [Ornithinimicrobium sp.]
MATMRDVALRAGVSAKTVSRVLREDPYVSDKVRARVHAAVAELQYVPNTMAISFRTGRDAAIGVAVPDIADPFFAQIVQAIEVEARAHQTAVIVTSLGYDSAYEQAAVEALLQRQVQGLVSCPVSTDQSYLRPWLQRTPIMFVDRAPTKVAADCVVEDDFGGAQVATAHLISHGHHRIAFFGGADQAPTTLKRLEGYRSALQDAGLTPDDALVFTGAPDAASLDDTLRRFTSLNEPPTAVFSSNARTTGHVFPALQRLRGPGMVLISFGDFPMAAALNPPVTVIDQDPTAVGTFAAQRLFERIAHPQKRLRRRTVLPVTLIERESCRLPVGGSEHDPTEATPLAHQEQRGA